MANGTLRIGLAAVRNAPAVEERLATLDRVNHLAAIAGWLGLTLGVVLAAAYSIEYRELNLPQLVWGSGAWAAVSCIALEL